MIKRIANSEASDERRFRRYSGGSVHPLEEPFMYFRGEGPVPETLRRLTERLNAAGIPFVIMGATALNAHGYTRMTEDIDVSMRPEDFERVRKELVGPGGPYERVPGRSRRINDPESGVTIDILIAGEIAGREDKQREVLFPEPSEAETIEGLPVVSLARLIELKLITWRLKDWADVIELIRVHKLNDSFAEQLKPAARSPYLECMDHMKEEDTYNAHHEPYSDPASE